MIYRLDVTENRNGKKLRGVKFGCTNQHAEDRAAHVEHSARQNGHDMRVKAKKYYFAPERSEDIARSERDIHSNSSYAKYSDNGYPFNGSTEIYTRKEARKIEGFLKKRGIRLEKCGRDR